MADIYLTPDEYFERDINNMRPRLMGRNIILSDRTSSDLRNKEILAKVLNIAKEKHDENKLAIDYLIDYNKGRQTILGKTKEIRPEINNRVVINHAQMVTRNVVGYFLGTPIQYVADGVNNKQDAVDELNRQVQYEDKGSVDRELGEYQSIVGTGYRIIYRDGEFADDVPFEDRSLHPSTTFIVYENSIAQKPLVGVTYYPVFDDANVEVGAKYYAYTDFGRYTINSQEHATILPSDIGELEPYDVGGVPIIEYPNNMWRIGDWELMIGLMDAINSLHSGRFDDIDQTIQSLLIFINAEIDAKGYREMRKEGVVSLTNTTGGQTDIKNIVNKLDQSGMEAFATQLEDLLYALLGIPNRNNKAGGGGDTGQAVELRDGWADLEIIARNKETTFKKSEKRTLKIILSIFNLDREDELKLMDIDIKFSRNKSNNLLVKTQSYETLMRTKTIAPVDALAIVDLVSDVNEFIKRGEAFWGEDFANRLSEKQEVAQKGIDNRAIELETKEI